MTKTLTFLAILTLTFSPGPGISSEPVEEKDGTVVLEAEDTASPIGNWIRKTDLEDFSGDAYLEFNGNTPINGPANSPLTYRFKIHREGLYFLHLRCARAKVDGRNDLANDCYVRIEGKFGPGPNPGDQHGKDAPLALLKKNTKFFGGDDRKFVWASGNRLDPGGHNNKRIAVYSFRAGESYTLVVSGRSQKFKLDKILFRHADVPTHKAERPR